MLILKIMSAGSTSNGGDCHSCFGSVPNSTISGSCLLFSCESLFPYQKPFLFVLCLDNLVYMHTLFNYLHHPKRKVILAPKRRCLCRRVIMWSVQLPVGIFSSWFGAIDHCGSPIAKTVSCRSFDLEQQLVHVFYCF